VSHPLRLQISVKKRVSRSVTSGMKSYSALFHVIIQVSACRLWEQTKPQLQSCVRLSSPSAQQMPSCH